MKTILSTLIVLFCISLSAQQNDVPVQINLKDGGSIDAKHFGQLKCGKRTYVENVIFIRGKFLGNVTEVKSYGDIEKIILEGFSAKPATGVGNEKGNIWITKKNGKTFTLENAEIVVPCFAIGDKYNQIKIQIENPLTNAIGEATIDIRDIQSIIFK